MITKLIYILSIAATVHACHPQFEKELRYLDLYLGIQPENDGEILQKEPEQFTAYVEKSTELNCDFKTECLWRNAPYDGLLDTSDFWFFKKTKETPFPIQIQPGATPPVGSHFVVAGNTTNTAQAAVLLSAPVACQRSLGNLTFNYWLYNMAKVEVIVVRSAPRRGHLMVLHRPKMNCHYLRPNNDICAVTLPQINEPFRIGLRAFNLKDNTVGSMTLLNDITYNAQVCTENPLPTMFESVALKPRPHAYASTIKEIQCMNPLKGCRWSNAVSTVSEWRVGRDMSRWNELMEVSATHSRPKGNFIFLVVDSLTPRPYATLRSELIPCTQRTATLSFKYWIRAGTQVEICSVDADGVPLSCAYLTEEDSPGPIEIDVEAYHKPFRFTIDVIAFDTNTMGIAAIEDLQFTGGLLCTEQPPPAVTTIDPPTISEKFGLRSKPFGNSEYPLVLQCDFSADYCNQWVNDDGKLQYGVAPTDSDEFPIPADIKGNVAMFVLKGKDASSVRSREVPCAYNAEITISYMRSEFGFVRACVNGQCIEGKKRSGTMILDVSSMEAFEIVIETSSKRNAIVVISEIAVKGDVCPLRTLEQMVCDRLKCDFKEGMCNYESAIDKHGDAPLVLGPKGLTAVIGEGMQRSILRSPRFDLPSQALLSISLTQYTFGSRVLLCPDIDVDSDACHELLGPRVLDASARRIDFPLDGSAHRFALVLFHDKAAQFGPAKFEIHSIDIRTSDDYQLCF